MMMRCVATLCGRPEPSHRCVPPTADCQAGLSALDSPPRTSSTRAVGPAAGSVRGSPQIASPKLSADPWRPDEPLPVGPPWRAVVAALPGTLKHSSTP